MKSIFSMFAYWDRLFEQFKEKVKRKVEFFSKEAKRLGIKQQLLLQ